MIPAATIATIAKTMRLRFLGGGAGRLSRRLRYGLRRGSFADLVHISSHLTGMLISATGLLLKRLQDDIVNAHID